MRSLDHWLLMYSQSLIGILGYWVTSALVLKTDSLVVDGGGGVQFTANNLITQARIHGGMISDRTISGPIDWLLPTFILELILCRRTSSSALVLLCCRDDFIVPLPFGVFSSRTPSVCSENAFKLLHFWHCFSNGGNGCCPCCSKERNGKYISIACRPNILLQLTDYLSFPLCFLRVH